jgi:hypothetical protein
VWLYDYGQQTDYRALPKDWSSESDQPGQEFSLNMIIGLNIRDMGRSPSDGVGLGQIELEVQEAYLADKQSKIARLDKHSMKQLRISAGQKVMLLAGDRPIVLKALPTYPSDSSEGIIRMGKNVRKQLRCNIGDSIPVRGVGKTDIDKVVNYLLLDKFSNSKE